MKKYRLFTAAEQISGILISLILVLCMVFLVFALRGDLLACLICIPACLLVAAGLGFYMANIFRAACIPHPEAGTLEVKGLPDCTLSMEGVVSLKTMAYKNGPVTTRTLVFSDRDDNVVHAVPTFFTAAQGAQAEPLAIALAQDLGLAFQPTLESWEYDREKRKQRQKDLAQEEKARRKARFRALKAKLLRKPEAGEPAPGLREEEPSRWDSKEAENSDGINYDLLDDEG